LQGRPPKAIYYAAFIILISRVLKSQAAKTVKIFSPDIFSIGNMKIGPEEVIYILHKTACLKQ